MQWLTNQMLTPKIDFLEVKLKRNAFCIAVSRMKLKGSDHREKTGSYTFK